MFSDEIEFLPERPGNRMTADVMVEKTKALGWSPKIKLDEYISMLKNNNWAE
jgi:UDP-glucose 4-epimerase